MDTREMVDRLGSLAVFRHLSEAKIEELVRVLAVQAVPAGTLVFEEGSVGDSMFFVAEGQVRIQKKVETGGAKQLALLSPGDVFGEMGLIGGSSRSARAVAHTDATLFVLGREDLDRWLRSDPLTTVGFFVELVRVVSHRLRHASEELVLLYDLSHLTLQRVEDESVFLGAVLRRIIPHLDGDWSGAAYLYNEFTDEVSRLATEGPRGDALPETLRIAESENRWLDDASFCVALPGKADTFLGFLVARNETAMSPREKTEFALTLTAAGHLLASALRNIKHDTEERLRARLERQTTYGSAP